MDSKTFEITEYKYGFLNSMATRDRHMIAHLYQKQEVVAIAYFQAERHEPQMNSRGIVNLFYPIEDGPGIIDMLRNEKPIFLHIEKSQAFLSTSMEPIGEGE
ncbi:MAG: hypothetical protein V3S89_07230 [Desulfobacterales bacterium]